ncbi:hypothetical protein [Dactylosporangium sp. CA-139066]|uniref:hypothetical protein n=1 Tax=Dactylosporangium sp. CA-139066 TaxID=3239930 RepID=UPI003D8A19C2
MPNHRLAALLGAALLAPAGCDSGAAPAPAPSASVSQQDARAAWLRVAECMRANGYPDFPDPTPDEHGVWNVNYPIQGGGPAACDALVRRAKIGSRTQDRISPSEMATLRQYAACMRGHGIAQFPDPDEDGNYGPVVSQLEADPAYPAAADACKQYRPPQRPK